ncbi:hypothetical protein G7Y89_g1616 [Cudoniella acicularis]|uniref:Uncharacterized protein n=1 Tax=Cudoniella acicularis TaxID=354080 RepID=A0A8H4WA39_9HELO|nr:hypothetical protein G7Y89_g1616 [Cudoniella acicularis]
MAAPASASSSLFMRLTNVWRHLVLRSDIDTIVLELLGAFSLEKIYSEGHKETYQHLTISLLAQLNSIFNIQRLSLPSENLQIGWYLGYLVSWEVTLRTVEFVLQTVVEARESLWEVEALRDKYLAEFLLSALRVLTLHPKAPTNQRAKDRRDRFARVHRSLERVFDSYPGQKSFLLLVCREVTDSLRTDPDSLALPPGLKYGLPNLASELYPLADSLSSQNISTIVTHNGFSNDWLPQFLALRDISLFVVGASVQYVANRDSREVRLQASSARARNAVLQALDGLRLPNHLSRVDLISTFSELYRIILPETPSLRRPSSEANMDESELDALDALCLKLGDRQVIQRMSDRDMMKGMSDITKKIALLNDPNGQFGASRPRLYSMNCENCHLVGDAQLRNSGHLKYPADTTENAEALLPANSKCFVCGKAVTMMREISIVRQIWEQLKPLEPNADTINVERHLPNQFQQAPPKLETGVLFSPSYGNILATGHSSFDAHSTPPRQTSPERSRSNPNTHLSPVSPGFRQIPDASRAESSSDCGTSKDGPAYGTLPQLEPIRSPPYSPDVISSPSSSRKRLESMSSGMSFEPIPPIRSRTIPLVAPPEKSKNKWRSRFGSKRESVSASGDSSSLSSTMLESQRLEEISLKTLINQPKKTVRGKSAKNVNVYLSKNSAYALFWNQFSIYVWDIGTSPPTMGRAVATESTCVLAVVSKVFLAYIIGTRDQKLTLRIVNLIQPAVPVVEYRMSSSLWCRSISICPKENYVVVGFDNSIVRFFSTSNSGEPPREDHLHIRYHPECKDCQPVETLSFSNDGLVLLASTRSAKSGTIQVYLWRYPFLSFEEVTTCRYQVPLHESEDGGITSTIFRAGDSLEENLICITSWTQSGVPILVQPKDGHKSEIRTEISNRQSKLGNRIQTAAFSSSGKDLAIVNDKGDLYKISNLNSNPMNIKKIATSGELTARSESLAMAFVTLPDEEAIVLAWADTSKGAGFIKKIPTSSYQGDQSMQPITQTIPESPKYELAVNNIDPPPPPVELVSPDTPSMLKSIEGLGLPKDSFL